MATEQKLPPLFLWTYRSGDFIQDLRIRMSGVATFEKAFHEAVKNLEDGGAIFHAGDTLTLDREQPVIYEMLVIDNQNLWVCVKR